MTLRAWLKQQLDIDQLLIFFLLGVTINQMGYYLASFAPAGMWWIGYLQAVAVDAAIWRSAHWYRLYTGAKQRRWSLVGIATFSLVSAWYNFGFYTLQRPAMAWWQRALMGAVLPAGVALLSYLKGVKDVSKFAVKEPKVAASEPQATEKEPQANGHFLRCDKCEREFAWPSSYSDKRSAQNAKNAHRCEGGER